MSADLLALLRASLAEQDAGDSRSLPTGLARCGDRGRHVWVRADGFATWRLLTCECGARAREDHEGNLFAWGTWDSPAPPAASREVA